MLKMGVFGGANQTERSLREGMIQFYFACLQDTCGVNLLTFFFGLKKQFQEKNATTFLRVRFFGKIQIRILVSKNGFCVSLPKSENGLITD